MLTTDFIFTGIHLSLHFICKLKKLLFLDPLKRNSSQGKDEEIVRQRLHSELYQILI